MDLLFLSLSLALTATAWLYFLAARRAGWMLKPPASPSAPAAMPFPDFRFADRARFASFTAQQLSAFQLICLEAHRCVSAADDSEALVVRANAEALLQLLPTVLSTVSVDNIASGVQQ